MRRNYIGAAVRRRAAPTAETTRAAPAATTTRVTFTNESWVLAVTDANKYKGSPVTLFRKIFLDPQRTADAIAFQMYAHAANSAQDTAVAGLPPTADSKRGDFVRVTGTIFDMLEGTNALNATLRIPQVEADSVVRVTRAEGRVVKLQMRLVAKVEYAGPPKASD